MTLATVEDHTFLTGPLGPGATVLDLGAHRGAFSRQIVERFGARCLAVEPLQECAKEIPNSISVHEVAIGSRDGISSFHVSDNTLASSLKRSERIRIVRTERVREVTFDTFLKEQSLATIELAKVDIEGAEKHLFESASDDALLRVAQFSVEFHDFLGLLSSEDVTRIVERLKGLSFDGIKFSRRSNYNWLFFQRARCGVEHPFVLRHVPRNALFVARNSRRLFRRQ